MSENNAVEKNEAKKRFQGQAEKMADSLGDFCAENGYGSIVLIVQKGKTGAGAHMFSAVNLGNDESCDAIEGMVVGMGAISGELVKIYETVKNESFPSKACFVNTKIEEL